MILIQVKDLGGDNLGSLYIPEEILGEIQTALQKRGLIGTPVEPIPVCTTVKDLPDWYGYDY